MANGTLKLWRDMDEVSNSGILNSISPEEKCLQENLFEILSSEASYLKSLDIMISNFIHVSEMDEKCCIINKRDKHYLFSNYVSVRDVSQRFLAALEIKFWNNVYLKTDILNIVSEFASGPFNVYATYCSNQVYQERTLNRLKDENPVFKNFVHKIEKSAVCQSLSMYSFLMLPMQRITRLPLLVDSVCQRIDPESEDYTIATKALSSLQQVVMKCNQGAQQMANLEQMAEINNSLQFKNIKTLPIISQTRNLVKHGELTLLEELRGKMRRNKLYIHVFNDLLLLSKKKREDYYQVVDYAPTKCVKIVEEVSSMKLFPNGLPKDCAHVFLLILQENNEKKLAEFLFACDSLSERMRWTESITPIHQEEDESIYEAWDCPQVQAIYKFTAEQPDELSLEESDVINVFRKINDGWYQGERIRDGAQGWFPGNYTVEIQSAHVRTRNLRQLNRLRSATKKVWLSTRS